MDLDAIFAEGFPVLEGRRVRLRGFAPADRADVFALYADRHAIRFGYAPKMDDLADADHVIAETDRIMHARTIFHFGVARRDDDRIIGHATLFQVSPPHRRAEIGYSTLPSLWGQGFGSEAVAVLLRFAFDTLGLRRIEADVDPDNPASLRVLEKHGFKREGYAPERWEIAGEIRDGVLLGLLRRDWPDDGAAWLG